MNVNHYVQHRFADVAVEFGYACAELVDVVGQQLVRVGYTIVQIVHFVICEVSAKTKTNIRLLHANETFIC